MSSSDGGATPARAASLLRAIQGLTPKLRMLIGALVVAVSLDVLGKSLIVAHIGYGERVPLLDGVLYLTHVRNPGAAFGLFADAAPGLRKLIFLVVSLLSIAVVYSFHRSLAPGDRLSALALGLILGGAMGNFIDRIFREEVVDFLHLRLWGGYAWPDFNFADVFIVVGVGALMLELLASEGASRSEGGAGANHSG